MTVSYPNPASRTDAESCQESSREEWRHGDPEMEQACLWRVGRLNPSGAGPLKKVVVQREIPGWSSILWVGLVTSLHAAVIVFCLVPVADCPDCDVNVVKKKTPREWRRVLIHDLNKEFCVRCRACRRVTWMNRISDPDYSCCTDLP